MIFWQAHTKSWTRQDPLKRDPRQATGRPSDQKQSSETEGRLPYWGRDVEHGLVIGRVLDGRSDWGKSVESAACCKRQSRREWVWTSLWKGGWVIGCISGQKVHVYSSITVIHLFIQNCFYSKNILHQQNLDCIKREKEWKYCDFLILLHMLFIPFKIHIYLPKHNSKYDIL